MTAASSSASSVEIARPLRDNVGPKDEQNVEQFNDAVLSEGALAAV